MAETSDEKPVASQPRRKLRAVWASDIANFSGNVSVSETVAFGHVNKLLAVSREEITRYFGDVICVPGDGIVALFESAVDALRCALGLQERLSEIRRFGGMRLRIGLHLGEVLFDGDLPFGEPINIAARLEALADPGGILVSQAVFDAVAARVSARFEERGTPRLKNIPRQIATFSVSAAPSAPVMGEETEADSLERTTRLPRLRSIAAGQGVAAAPDNVAFLDARGPKTAAPAGAGIVEQRQPAAVDGNAKPKRAARKSALGAVASAREQGLALSDEQMRVVTVALTHFMGPVARLLIARAIQVAPDLDKLLSALEAEIPSIEDKSAFINLVRAHLPPHET